jgi:hypothetical protein
MNKTKNGIKAILKHLNLVVGLRMLWRKEWARGDSSSFNTLVSIWMILNLVAYVKHWDVYPLSCSTCFFRPKQLMPHQSL